MNMMKTVQIIDLRYFLEKNDLIEEALVKLSYDVNAHKDEQLEILLVSSMEMVALNKIVKCILQENYKKINIRTTLQKVELIAKNHMGKKLRK